MAKKKNTAAKANQSSSILPENAPQLVKTANGLVEKGATVGLIIGFNNKGQMMIDANLNSYEEIHAALNRATIEVTMAHIKHINESIAAEEAKEAE